MRKERERDILERKRVESCLLGGRLPSRYEWKCMKMHPACSHKKTRTTGEEVGNAEGRKS